MKMDEFILVSVDGHLAEPPSGSVDQILGFPLWRTSAQ